MRGCGMWGCGTASGSRLLPRPFPISSSPHPRISAFHPVLIIRHEHVERDRVGAALQAIVGDVDRGRLDGAPAVVLEAERELIAGGEIAGELDLVARLAAGHRCRLTEQAEDRLHELVAESGMELAPHAPVERVDLLELRVAEDDVVELEDVLHSGLPGDTSHHDEV